MWATVDKGNRFSGTWAEAQAIKEEIFRRASIGALTGNEADAEAERLGMGALSQQPGRDEFRPENLSQWTFAMAVAWISYRDIEEVRNWSSPYREACFDWIWRRYRVGLDGPIQEGWHLEQRHRPTLSLLAIGAALDGAEGGKPLAMPVRDAKEALWAALQEGLFSANGIDLETDRRTEIPALDWHELVAVEGRGEIDEVRRGPMGSGFRDLLLPSTALRGIWRPVSEKPLTLTQSIPPAGEGYMPLYCAAQWIATKGATVEFDPKDGSFWRTAYDELLSAIASEKVRVVGTHNGQREVVPGFHFAGCQVDYPYSSAELDVLAGEDVYLRSYPYLDEEHWRGGFDDALINRREERWTRLMVEKGDVRARWPYPLSETHEENALRSGMPGRPAKSRHLIEDEFRRRATAGELADSLTVEADVLLEWLRSAHPHYPRPTTRTIENYIRDEYRRQKTTK
jgi:hypothetical protein